MNLPADMARCDGDFRQHWMAKHKYCPKRDECLRHVQIGIDEAFYPGRHFDRIAYCADDGTLTGGPLTGFTPLDAYKDEDE